MAIKRLRRWGAKRFHTGFSAPCGGAPAVRRSGWSMLVLSLVPFHPPGEPEERSYIDYWAPHGHRVWFDGMRFLVQGWNGSFGISRRTASAGGFRSVAELESAIQTYIANHNAASKPFI